MFIKILDEVYEQEKNNKPEKARKSTGWRCSSLGSCKRGQFLSRLLSNDFEVMHDRRTMDVFELGNVTEDLKIKMLKKHKDYVIMTQGEMRYNEINLTGHFDALVFQKSTGDLFMFECKSKNSRAFTYMDNKKEGAMHHHKLQISSYMNMVNRHGFTLPVSQFKDEDLLYYHSEILPMLNNDQIFYVIGYTKAPDGSDMDPIYVPKKEVSEGYILYVSKDDQRLLEYPIYSNDRALVKEWFDEVVMLEKAYVNKDVLPENEKGSWQSKYCKFCEAGLCSKINDKQTIEALFEAVELAEKQKTEPF